MGWWLEMVMEEEEGMWEWQEVRLMWRDLWLRVVGMDKWTPLHPHKSPSSHPSHHHPPKWRMMRGLWSYFMGLWPNLDHLLRFKSENQMRIENDYEIKTIYQSNRGLLILFGMFNGVMYEYYIWNLMDYVGKFNLTQDLSWFLKLVVRSWQIHVFFELIWNNLLFISFILGYI